MERVLIKARQLTKRYGAVPVVNGLNLEVEGGEIFGFLGPNGSGKTTTIKMILGLLSIDSGSILVDGAPVLIVLAGDAKVNNTKFKAAFHQKAKMLGHEQVAELTGFPVGGVCPFLAPEGVKVYLDESLKRFDTVFPAAGTPNSAVEVTLPQLEAASHAAGWVDVSQIVE